ncbi:MAG: hypothetical protein JNM56_06035 [Planctomycetia bacterium]|nr:hypothetical protein [Planctomycetia bacterium]
MSQAVWPSDPYDVSSRFAQRARWLWDLKFKPALCLFNLTKPAGVQLARKLTDYCLHHSGGDLDAHTAPAATLAALVDHRTLGEALGDTPCFTTLDSWERLRLVSRAAVHQSVGSFLTLPVRRPWYWVLVVGVGKIPLLVPERLPSTAAFMRSSLYDVSQVIRTPKEFRPNGRPWGCCVTTPQPPEPPEPPPPPPPRRRRK